jgi:hypothetical protein
MESSVDKLLMERQTPQIKDLKINLAPLIASLETTAIKEFQFIVLQERDAQLL